MKLFLDDVRNPFECASYMYRRIGHLNPIYTEGEWYIVKNYDQFTKAVNLFYELITHVSFDHDLADTHYTPEEYWDDYDKSKEWQDAQAHTEKTGYECAQWLKDFYDGKGLELPVMFVHSMNPVGTDKIVNLFSPKT
jgi:hypothetical protein